MKNNKRYYRPRKKNNNCANAEMRPEAESIQAAEPADEALIQEILFDEHKASAEQPEQNVPTTEIVGVRFRHANKIYYFSPCGIDFADGECAIVETVRGTEFSTVAIPNRNVPDSELVLPLKPVLRKATDEDIGHDQYNRKLEREAIPVFEKKVKENDLDMQLVDVEYTFDNTKLIFYFTADGRVDFRELVKDLASVFRTRIELRQIGVRDEARLYGGLGVCGRPFCCKTFLQDFAQVSIKMAKEQNLSLSSSKISGTCGRLMCCLRYENAVYEMEYANFPKVDSIVETPQGRGVVVESNFLTGNIKVKMNNQQNDIKTFTKKDLKVVGMIKVRDDTDAELKKLEDN